MVNLRLILVTLRLSNFNHAFGFGGPFGLHSPKPTPEIHQYLAFDAIVSYSIETI